MAKKLVKNYVFTPGVSIDENILPNAYSLISQNRQFIIKEIVAFIQNLVTAGDSSYVGYTFSTVKCERDSGYVIDALLHDLRYGGNEEIRYVASQYWDGTVAQIDGSRIPEYEAYEFARDLINTYILTNTADPSPEQVIELQVIDGTKTTEAGSYDRVSTLLTNVKDVIENGLSSLPAQDIKLGRVEVLGKIELEDILLISNVTDNVVIYNFAEPTKGGTVEFNEGNSTAYPNALQVNNGTTVIRFKYDTSAMSSSDSIQIFLENTELRVRPYDFGTDAIERMRVAQPQAMIDADFEYGLQPTKWQAIGTQRGYPATYEVSATDITVSSVITDASVGTSGIGGSLITVTTVAPHGLSVGQAISIRALASSITGFARAEGTFIIYSVPSTTSLTYYAKAKVGTSSGQVLATTTTQLRQSAFYTGASVGQPIFTVYSNGSSGSFTTALRTESGQNTLAFIGLAPPIGAPLSGTNIATGTQVAGVFGPSNSDGIVDYRYVKTTYGSGVSAIDLVDVAGLQAGMAVGNEASPNILREISSIGGSTLNLSSSVTVGHTGDQSVYNGGATAVVTSGLNAFFNISVTSGVYSITGIGSSGGGSDWAVGDTALITGDFLGGTTPTNDLYINIDTVSGGAVTGATISSGTGTGTGTYSDIEGYGSSSRGTGGGNWFITRSAGTYSLTAFPGSGGTGYFVGNKFKIAGTNLEGASPANDVNLVITAVSAPGGYPTSATISGTAARGDQIPVYATVTLSENTTGIVSASATITYSSIATIQVAWPTDHGFVPGTGLNVAISSSGTNHVLASGPFAVEEVVSSNVIRYTARSSGTVDTATLLQGTVYVRPDTFFTHRPFDGGVQLGTGGPQHGGQAIRQSKKYIRYQSGKGAMYNTGALFAPSFDIRSVTASSTASGAIITVVTDDVDHGLQAGAGIRLRGILTTGYNGDYTVSEIVDERTFRVVAQTALGDTTATIGSQCQMALVTWHGAVVRSGPFDDQNGIFFQYDGQKLAVGRRSSTFQIAGTVAINADSNAVTGTNTRFLDQLQEGDRIVIRGMTHVVAKISSNTVMSVTPDFRGVNNVSGVKVCKVQDIIVPQSEWNLDRCDGTGPSGYNIDITTMQMIGIQFSWYGAGFIDWMIRGPSGEYTFCHRLKGNNLNTEAYMRTGNAPVRYEVLNEGARSRLTSSIDDSQTTIVLDDVSDFPVSGTIYVDNEVISYSGRNLTTNQLTGCTRSASLSNFAAGATRTYTAGIAASHNAKQGVVLISCTTSPIISHWGSAYLIDGNFDEDRGYIFNYAATGVSASTSKRTAFLIRLAPSVSNAVTGDLGERELLNRAQLLLNALSVTSDTVSGGGAIVVEGILNPTNYPLNPANISWNGLNSAAAGGQPSFAQIALGGSVSWGSGSSTTTATVAGAVTTTVSARGLALVTFSMTTRAIFFGNRSLINGFNYFYITISDYNGFTTKPLVGDGITGTGIQSNTTITQVSQWDGTYYRIDMSRTANSDVSGNGSVTVTNQISSNYNRAFRSDERDFLITNAEASSSGLQVGDTVSSANLPSTTVSTITSSFVTLAGTAYTRIQTAGKATSSSTGGVNISTNVTASQTASSYSGTNYLFFTAATFPASGATIGTRLDSTVTQFPAGTTVSGISTRTLGATTVYRVSFTQTSNTSIAAAATITFAFGAEYALPGEQVFSFICNPGETSTLDLSALKELGTTAIGGRGTFPNGPDVLAINIFKVSGSATPTNLILRWGEAQA